MHKLFQRLVSSCASVFVVVTHNIRAVLRKYRRALCRVKLGREATPPACHPQDIAYHLMIHDFRNNVVGVVLLDRDP